MKPQLVDDETRFLFSRWFADTVLELTRPDTGTINDVRLVTTSGARYILRLYTHPERERIDREIAVIDHVRAHGIPAVPPIPLPDGGRYFIHDGKFVTLLPFVTDRQPLRQKLTKTEIKEMGRFLGRLNRVLSDCDVPHIPPLRKIHSTAGTIAEISRILDKIEVLPDKADTDTYMIDRLRTRISWLRNRPSHTTIDTDTFDAHPLHGDYQETNVFFKGDTISAIIDWDKIYRGPAAWSVIRTLDLMLRFDLEKSNTFLDGYRQENTMSVDELDRTAQLYGDLRAHDLWLPREIYDRGNDRPRRFVFPGTFVPIVDRWCALRRTL